MSARSIVTGSVTRLLGTRPLEQAAVAASSKRLRILAYHRVPDADAFGLHLAHLARHYRVVSGAQVADALAGGPPLPPRAVWITFDDGDPTVVHTGLDVLSDAGLTATVFVCPALIEAGRPPWWSVVEAAGDRGIGAEVGGTDRRGRDLVRALKVVPDRERRAVLEHLVSEDPGAASGRSGDGVVALTTDDLTRWLDAGQEIGNHTWDHPCLDQCTPDEQAAQLEQAHEWLERFLGGHPRLFAYPNGDHTADAEAVLARLGYEVGLLFDHGLADLGQPPLRLSRLRLDSDAPLPRARAVLSGTHGALLGAVS